ncbi:MAG: hypothetical protein A2017_05200 [Lentisphaerae bacterium GWF2_44_16]|nr:MAG: hypothetical protein A2017_05200 [Lentisphaerae bacterium GWF2_44_16]
MFDLLYFSAIISSPSVMDGKAGNKIRNLYEKKRKNLDNSVNSDNSISSLLFSAYKAKSQ